VRRDLQQLLFHAARMFKPRTEPFVDHEFLVEQRLTNRLFLVPIPCGVGNADRDQAFPLYEDSDVTKPKGLLVVLQADLQLTSVSDDKAAEV
jgi:hypothetical protein